MRPTLLLLALLGAVPVQGVAFDLIAALPVAEVQREPGRIDLGTPAAHEYLLGGWSRDEGGGSDRTYVWSDGPESELRFFLAAPRDLRLSFRCSPFEYRGSPPQAVTFVLNGEEVLRVGLAPRSGDYRVRLPAGALRMGENRLVFRYAWARSPREVTGQDSQDRRRLAVAWEDLRFHTERDEASTVRAAGGQLSLPFGSRIDYYTPLPPGAFLEIERLRAGSGGGTLAVVFQAEGEEPATLARLGPRDAPQKVELPDAGRRPVRLSLVAVPDAHPARSGLVLTRPMVRSEAVPKASAARVGAPTSPPARPKNVLIYLVDTLRPDHLGCYGYAKPVSPHIDAFAKEATLFQNAVAQSPWTRPSTASLLTGLWPRTHDVNGRRDALAPEALTFAEMLKGHGYRTAAFVTNGNIAKSLGFGQGFDSYNLLPGRSNRAHDVTARTAEWLDANGRGDAPFFLYLHTVEPHSPYDPPPDLRARFAPGIPREVGLRRWLKRLNKREIPFSPRLRDQLLALYDAEIAANDRAFGDVVALLKARGLWEETAVVFLSDHGEEFYEHGGWEHGNTLYGEMLQIPLIVRLPGLGAGRTVARQGQHIDIVPTLLAWLGLPIPSGVEGRSLLPLVAGQPAPHLGEDAVFSWMEVDGHRGGAVTTPDWRLIDLHAPRPDLDLFDRWRDLLESKDLALASPVRAGYLRALLRARELERRQGLTAGEGVIDEEVREQLRALGYIQ